MLFPFIAGLAAFVLLFKPLHSRAFMSVINGTSRMRWNRFFVSMLIWGILSVIYFLVYLKMDPENFSLVNTGTTVIILTVVSLIFIPFQAALEEVLFRGYLMQGFSLIVDRRWFPLITTSLFFALLHGVNPEVKEYGFLTMMPQYILFGLIFGIITIMDDGVEVAIGAHAANNIFLCITVTNKSSALQTAAIYEQLKINPWMEFAGLLVSGIIFILILKVIFKWQDFSLLSGRVEKSPVSDSVN
jgi:membrane protease YdiL (CAAX protease family)